MTSSMADLPRSDSAVIYSIFCAILPPIDVLLERYALLFADLPYLLYAASHPFSVAAYSIDMLRHNAARYAECIRDLFPGSSA